MRARLALLAVTGAVTLAGAGALAQAEAERRLDAAIERLRASLGDDARIAWGQRRVDPVTGQARLGDVVVTAGGRRVTIAEVLVQDAGADTLGRAELRGLLMQEAKGERIELARLLVGGMPLPGPDGFDVANASLSALELDGLRASNRDGSLSVARLRAEGYVPGALGTAQVEDVQFQGAGGDANSFRLGRLAVTAMAMPRFGDDLDPRAFTIESLVLENGALRDPGSQVDLQIARLSLRDWVHGRATELGAEALRLAVPIDSLGASEMRVARIAARGIDAAAVTAAVWEGVQIPDPVEGTPQSLVIEGVTLAAERQPVFALARLAADGGVEPGGTITGGLALEGMRATLPRGTVGMLDELGYQDIGAGFELRGTLRREGGVLEVRPLRFGVDQAGTLTVTAAATGIPAPPPGASALPDDYLAQATQARLAGLTLSWRDQGLLGRVLAQQARAQRIPEARLREEWAQMALTMPIPGAPAAAPPPPRGRQPAGPPPKVAGPAPTPTAPGIPPKGVAPAPTPAPTPAQAPAPAQGDPFLPLREALAAFIRQPREIEIALRPAQPVLFTEVQAVGMRNPAEAMRLLGLTVRLP